MMVAKRLSIEVAFPLKQVSLEAVREKNVRDGHVSTVRIWPARQRLVTCRAAYIHARVVPARDRKEAERFDADMEALAVQIASGYEKRIRRRSEGRVAARSIGSLR